MQLYSVSFFKPKTVLDKVTFWKTHAQDPLSERQHKVINRMLDAALSSPHLNYMLLFLAHFDIIIK